MEYIQKLLKDRADEKYGDFHSKLVPTVDRNKIIGVRTPVMRALAKSLVKDKGFCEDILPDFLNELPHYYYDEMILHGEIISLEKDFDKAVELVEKFLPYVDNWAVCDLLSPKAFAKDLDKLFDFIKKWLASDEVYTVRFGIDMMLKYFLDDRFETEHLYMVRDAVGDDYYIKMAKAWYFSFALIKHYDVALEFVKSAPMDEWIRKKSIQKARESYRLTDAQKAELKSVCTR